MSKKIKQTKQRREFIDMKGFDRFDQDIIDSRLKLKIATDILFIEMMLDKKDIMTDPGLTHERARALRLYYLHLQMGVVDIHPSLKEFILYSLGNFVDQWFDDDIYADLNKIFGIDHVGKRVRAKDTEISVHVSIHRYWDKVQKEHKCNPPMNTCTECGIVGYLDEMLATFPREEKILTKYVETFERDPEILRRHECPKLDM